MDDTAIIYFNHDGVESFGSVGFDCFNQAGVVSLVGWEPFSHDGVVSVTVESLDVNEDNEDDDSDDDDDGCCCCCNVGCNAESLAVVVVTAAAV